MKSHCPARTARFVYRFLPLLLAFTCFPMAKIKADSDVTQANSLRKSKPPASVQAAHHLVQSGTSNAKGAPAPSVANLAEKAAHGQNRALPRSRIPLYFEKNQGQQVGEVRYLARGAGYTAFLTDRETVLQYSSGMPGQTDSREATVRMSLAGSQAPSEPWSSGRLEGVVNYLIGNDPSQWHTKIPTFSEIHYDHVYPGVDLVYRGSSQNLEFDFHVAPGADPNRIRMAYSGASKMHLNDAGDLILETQAGPASILKPVVYQAIGEKRVQVAGNYRLLANGEVGFQLGKYDRREPLVIDPSVYYATYLGSGAGGSESSQDTFTSISADAAGETFICGTTTSSSYPTSGSPIRSTFPNGVTSVGFVTALTADGTQLKYSTYISGTTAGDTATLAAIAADANGYAFVGGQTDDPTFPVANAFQSSLSTLASYLSADTGHTNGIIFELSQDGSSFVYSSFLGGPDLYQGISAIAVDSSDNAYVTGSVSVYSASTAQFPVTAGVVWGDFTQTSDPTDAFAAKIAPPSGGNATKVYATLIGSENGVGTAGPSETAGNGIAVDSSGNAYVTGISNSDITDHGGVTTKNNMTHVTPDTGNELLHNVWVLELNSDATAATYVDYLGGSSPSTTFTPDTYVVGIAVDSSNQAYVTGTTQASNFETTSDAYQASPQLAGVEDSSSSTYQSDAYVTIIASGGGSFVYSTYLNGKTLSNLVKDNYASSIDGSAMVGGIALGPNGQFAVTGFTDTSDFPTTSSITPVGSPVFTTFDNSSSTSDPAAGFAVFVTKFQPPLSSGGGLLYSVFAGAGGEFFNPTGLASSGSDLYVMFPEYATGLATSGAYNTTNSSGSEDLIVHLQDPGTIDTTHFSVSASSQQSPGVQFSLTVTALQSDNSTDAGFSGTVHFTSSDSAATLPGNYTFTPGDDGTHVFNATLNSTGPQTITATQVASPSITGVADITVSSAAAAPVLSIVKSHTGNFTQGQTGTWTISVSNTEAGSTTSGAVTVLDTLSSGLTVASASGTDWSCTGTGTGNLSCTNSDAVTGGGSFGAITLVANVPAASPTNINNTASAYGGGSTTQTNPGHAASYTDSVTVNQVPATTTMSAGSGQSAFTNTAFADQLEALVEDAGGVAIPNVTVTFQAPTSGPSGTFTSPTGSLSVQEFTNPSGIATSPTFYANGSVGGPYSVTAKASTGAAAFFVLTNLMNPNVTSSVSVTANGLLYTPSGTTAGYGVTTFVVTNTSTTATINGPIFLLLQPGNGEFVENATGTYNGYPYVQDNVSSLAPGASVPFIVQMSYYPRGETGSASATVETVYSGVLQ